MPLPSSDPVAFQGQLSAITTRMGGSSEASALLVPLEQLVGILTRTDRASALEGREISEIGDYGMQVLANCSQYATDTQDDELQQEVGLMAVGLALWVSEQGGELSTLEPIVDTLAWLANNTRELRNLAILSSIMGKIIDACSLAIRSDLENMNPGRPWRVININRSIAATRSHNPDVMETAFQALIKHLPQDAPNFFAEGMSEMERLGYPDHVRKVMSRYYEQWNEPHIIH